MLQSGSRPMTQSPAGNPKTLSFRSLKDSVSLATAFPW
jgi:hypothetical protein